MNTRIYIAVATALATGIAIAVQATLVGRVGTLVGPIRTGLMVNAAGGTVAVVLLVALLLFGHIGIVDGEVPSREITVSVVGAGILGLLIIMGVAFSVKNLGVTAGLAAVILTQLVGGLILDRSGVVTGTGIAIDFRRILGILSMGVGVWLLIPRSG